ncbi:MAG: hypothetical protein MJK08_10430 [Campylobacterales bacterium]|nr:hypothetical protein [Campylobacterales bacterium]
MSEEQKTKITIIDGVCGSGKTIGIMEFMKQHRFRRFIYFTPTLSECHRVAGTEAKSCKKNAPKALKNGEYIYDKPSEYNCSELEFKHPISKGSRGQKTSSFIELINEGKNIVSSHKMFTQLGADTQQLISEMSYVGVLDEVVDPMDKHIMSALNQKEMFKDEKVYTDTDGVTLRWNYDKYPDKRKVGDNFYKEQKLADSGNLIKLNDTVILWEMSQQLFESFSEVYILTYQFKGSMLEWFFNAKGITYEVEDRTPKNLRYGNLINIIEDERMNAVGEGWSALSVEKTKELQEVVLKELKGNMTNLRKRVWTEGGVKSRMYTCLNSATKKLAVDGWKSAHVVHNIRGSNDYRHVVNCAYLYNVFLSPNHKQYFKKLGVRIDEETYALNSLLQWLFRSQLRDRKPINIYIPSRRMRELLKKWCNEN